MVWPRFGMGFALIVTVVGACVPTSPDLEAEAMAVRALWDETNAALAAKDWDRYQRVWLQEPGLKVIHPAQADWIDGWSAFSDRYEALFSSEREFAVDTHRFDVEVSSAADMAWATIQADLFVDGVPAPQWYVMIARKVEGEWRIEVALDSPQPASTGR